MYYVEYLRVLRALRIFGIVVLGIMAFAGVMRLGIGTHWSNYFVDDMSFTPSAKKTVKILGDGTELTVVDDHLKGRRVVVQRRSPGLLDVVTYSAPPGKRLDPTKLPAVRQSVGAHVSMGPAQSDINGIHMTTHTLPDDTEVTHYVNDRHIPIDIFLVSAGFIASIFASIIGGSLSKENDGHLELAWTKPVSRQNYALTLFGIDAAAIVAASAIVLAAGLGVAAMYFGVPLPTASPDTPGNIVLALLFPLAWYALGQALSASLRRAGLIMGMMWVAGTASISLLAIDNDLFRTVLRVINTFNPLAYYSSQNGHPSTFNGVSMGLLPTTQFFDILGLCTILIVATVASLVQWRRLEA